MAGKIDKKTLTCVLLKKFINSVGLFSSDLKKAFENHIDDIYEEGNDKFYEILEVIDGNQEKYIGKYMSFIKSGNAYLLSVDNEKVSLKDYETRKIIGGFSDINEDVLPMGTMVRLKGEYLGKLTQNKFIDEADFMISGRFTSYKGIKAYFHYEGYPYPFGRFGLQGKAEKFMFTPNMIEEILHRGYEDERETAYIYAAKNSIVMEQNMISVQFAEKDEQKKFQERSEKLNARN